MSQLKAVDHNTFFNQTESSQPLVERDFHGAAIIDEQGKEVPITEEMVQKACEEFSSCWLFPRQQQKH